MASAAADSNGTSDNVSDEASVKHFSANSSSSSNWPLSTTQFAILYKGSMCVYDGIPADKVHEIILIAAAAAASFSSAKSSEMKSGVPFTSLSPTSPSSPQGTSNNLASPQSVCFPAEKNSICRLQGEFPLARRQSLQSFLEKRRIRLGSKAPYTSSTANENTPEFANSLNDQRKDFSSALVPLGGN